MIYAERMRLLLERLEDVAGHVERLKAMLGPHVHILPSNRLAHAEKLEDYLQRAVHTLAQAEIVAARLVRPGPAGRRRP